MARTGSSLLPVGPRRRLAAAAVALATAAAPLLVAAPAAQAAPLLAPGIEIVSLATGLQDPTNLDVAPDGRVFIAERTGRVKIWHPDRRVTEAGRVGVDAKADQCSDCPGRDLDEGGLHGILLARDFATTGHVYLYRSLPNSKGKTPITPKKAGARGPQATEGVFRLSRYTITAAGKLDLTSEVPLMENPAEWAHCCHYGGDMEWLADGTMVLSVGDDTISSQSGGYSPHDQRIGQEFNSAMLTSQNPADRRGKILRIDVSDLNGDGSLIPTDNPYLSKPEFDPYVYAMGFRSNYRFAVDPKTQSLIVGNVGPDGRAADPQRGPAAHDEIEVVPPGGGTNHGWPKCIAGNVPYNEYDYEVGAAGAPFDCTGMVPAAFSYTYAPNPTTNTNLLVTPGIGNAVEAGVAYRAGTKGALALPAQYQDRLWFMDWSRGGVQTLPLSANGGISNTLPTDLALIERGFSTPIDMGTGPDGAIYFLEYGGSLYNGGAGELSRIQCEGCKAVAADYEGLTTPIVEPPAAPGTGSVSTGTRGLPTLAPVALAGLVLTTAAGWRRRRAVV